MARNAASREYLIELFRHALDAVRAERLAEQALRGKAFTHAIALGKAADALAAGAWRASFARASFPRRRKSSLKSGFLACPQGYETSELPAKAPFERHAGAHPVPDASSLDAGAALLDFVKGLPAAARLAVLVSGGASASVEVTRPGIDLELLQRANRWLLASGLPIEAVNRVRAGLSSIKGGRLASQLQDLEAEVWVLSDIPGDNLEPVGGGLFASLADVPLARLPGWLERALQPIPTTPCSLPLRRLGGNALAVAAVVEQGAHHRGNLEGDAAEFGREIGRMLVDGEPGCYIWGGETTVRLPAHPGRGGRCQQLALAAAIEVAGRDDCFLLSAGTDGRDGTDPVAGACVDGGTIGRGEATGLDARNVLVQADAYSFFKASGDLLDTGPTGTHVNDLVIACKCKSVDSGLS